MEGGWGAKDVKDLMESSFILNKDFGPLAKSTTRITSEGKE